MQTQVLKLKEVVAITSLSRSSIYRLVQSNEFPKPIKPATHASGWLADEVQNWLEARAALRGAREDG